MTTSPRSPAVPGLVRSTFDAAADHFDDASLFFWAHCGRRTIELIRPAACARVLDVCCGSGSSALAAAELIGPRGRVLGVDLSENLLGRARAKAARRGLSNIEFRQGDMNDIGLPDESFDLVVCVFGLYFAADIAAGLRELWRMVRSGGALAVTTWGRRALEPANRHYLAAVSAEWPAVRVTEASVSWTRINSAESLGQVFVDGGAGRPRVVAETLRHPISVDDFWTVVLGSGYRIFLDQAGPAIATRIRRSFARRMTEDGVESLVADVLYAGARKS